MKSFADSVSELTPRVDKEANDTAELNSTNSILADYVGCLTFCCMQLVNNLSSFIQNDLSGTDFTGKTVADYESLLDNIFTNVIDCNALRSFGRQVNMADITTPLVYSLKMDITMRLYALYYSDAILNPVVKELNASGYTNDTDLRTYKEMNDALSKEWLLNKNAWRFIKIWRTKYSLPCNISPFVYFLATLRGEPHNKDKNDEDDIIPDEDYVIFKKQMLPANLSLTKYTKHSESLLNILKTVNNKEDNQYILALNMFMLNFFSGHYENTVAYSQHHFRNKNWENTPEYRRYMPQSIIDHDILPKKLFFTQFFLLQLFSDWKSCEVVELIENLDYSADFIHTALYTNSALKTFDTLSTYCECIVSLLSRKIYENNKDIFSLLSGNKYLSQKNIREYFPFSLYQKGLTEKDTKTLSKDEKNRKKEYLALRREIIRKLDEPPSWPMDPEFVGMLDDVGRN